MPSIIFEGPDGAGKSYIASYISTVSKIPIYHAGGPPKTPEEIVERANKMVKMENKIFDRFPIISEQIYGTIVRDNNPFNFGDLKDIPFPVVYCRPFRETLLSSEKIEKDYKAGKHMKSVLEKYEQIIDKYDELMSSLPHLTFNRDLESCADFLTRLERTILRK